MRRTVAEATYGAAPGHKSFWWLTRFQVAGGANRVCNPYAPGAVCRRYRASLRLRYELYGRVTGAVFPTCHLPALLLAPTRTSAAVLLGAWEPEGFWCEPNSFYADVLHALLKAEGFEDTVARIATTIDNVGHIRFGQVGLFGPMLLPPRAIAFVTQVGDQGLLIELFQHGRIIIRLRANCQVC